jgi:hypothetical protein
MVSDSAGLCNVTGIGRTIESSSFGRELQGEFNELRQALTGRYGPGQKYDFVDRGSIWDGDNDWMMALYKKERVLSAFWTREHGSVLPADLQTVDLSRDDSGTLRCRPPWAAAPKSRTIPTAISPHGLSAGP